MSLRGEYLGMPVLIDDLDKDNQRFYRYCGQNELRAQVLRLPFKRLPPTSHALSAHLNGWSGGRSRVEGRFTLTAKSRDTRRV